MEKLSSMVGADGSLKIEDAKKEVTGVVKTLNLSKKQTNEAIGFGIQKINDFTRLGPSLLQTTIPFNEINVLNNHSKYISSALGIDKITIENAEGSSDEFAKMAQPGNPKVSIVA